LPPSARRCYPAAPDSPNAWPSERGRVKPTISVDFLNEFKIIARTV
jgi:hypothetical protein